MIIRTKIDWLQNKELSTEEREILDAKREFLESYDEYEEEYEETTKEAILDTFNNKIYIQVEENKICLIELLGGQYIQDESGAMRKMEERLYFESTLDELYDQLIKDSNK